MNVVRLAGWPVKRWDGRNGNRKIRKQEKVKKGDTDKWSKWMQPAQ